mmetsp:Transcript_25336/g.69978  ORF Transcript_25336/g.69978 Transcript_25336/m.69978 type:complete len:237 (-) Transcript_25336:351-1061(-)
MASLHHDNDSTRASLVGVHIVFDMMLVVPLGDETGVDHHNILPSENFFALQFIHSVSPIGPTIVDFNSFCSTNFRKCLVKTSCAMNYDTNLQAHIVGKGFIDHIEWPRLSNEFSQKAAKQGISWPLFLRSPFVDRRAKRKVKPMRPCHAVTKDHGMRWNFFIASVRNGNASRNGIVQNTLVWRFTKFGLTFFVGCSAKVVLAGSKLDFITVFGVAEQSSLAHIRDFLSGFSHTVKF